MLIGPTTDSNTFQSPRSGEVIPTSLNVRPDRDFWVSVASERRGDSYQRIGGGVLAEQIVSVASERRGDSYRRTSGVSKSPVSFQSPRSGEVIPT